MPLNARVALRLSPPSATSHNFGAARMPRPPRLHVPGGYYHVILRGNHREPIFATGGDRRVLDEIVGDVLARFDTRAHAYCWMTNHLHLLLQIGNRRLGDVMQRIAMRYSRYRHQQMRTTGHLFERRYIAKLVDVDAYFLVLLRYIHLNPVKALMVSDPTQYPWSSHRSYLGIESTTWLATSFALSLFSSDLARARAAYAQFIHHGTDCEYFDLESPAGDSRVLGTDRFISSIPLTPSQPRNRLTLEELAESICSQHRVSLQLLRSPSRARDLADLRALLTTRAIEEHIATLSEVARYLHRDPCSLTKLLARRHRRMP